MILKIISNFLGVNFFWTHTVYEEVKLANLLYWCKMETIYVSKSYN